MKVVVPYEHEEAGCFGYAFRIDIVASPHWVLSIEVASHNYVWAGFWVHRVCLDRSLHGLSSVVEPFFVHGCDFLDRGYIDREDEYFLRWCLELYCRNVWAAAWGLAMGRGGESFVDVYEASGSYFLVVCRPVAGPFSMLDLRHVLLCQWFLD